MDLDVADIESVSSDHTSCSNGNVQVVVRVRPPSVREKEQGYLKCVGVDPSGHSVTLNFRPLPRTFTFDHVSDEAVNQEEIFTFVGKPITDACLQGYHCCLIAYGQTGAGKTFTMEGPDTDSPGGMSPVHVKINARRHEKRGLIPRILEYIFQRMAAERSENCKDVEFLVKCSYLQIYNEQVSDLLDPGSTNLTIHEDAKCGMHVEGLQEVVVSTPEATYGVFRRGSENRHVGMTAMNMESSRSHSVFTLVVESQHRNDGGVMNRRTSRFYLVDLAGSERQKHSESAGIRLKEAGSINKSLSALGNVIKALVDISEGKIRHVPYRDSKLTFLLKDALGGNSKCTLIANVSPAEKNIDETLSTLKFAQRAKLIHNTAIVNEDMFGNPAVMGEEIRRLRLEIAALRANMGANGEQSILSSSEVLSEGSRISRLEHIISQSVKRSLVAERKTASDLHSLAVRLEATQAMCERLEKTSQSQKMIVRLRENTIKRLEAARPSLVPDEIVKDLREEIEHLRKQIEHHPDVVRFKMELDLCRVQLDEYKDGRKDEDGLQAQIDQLEIVNQALKLEIQEIVDEKSKISMEVIEANQERDCCKAQMTAMEDQYKLLREALEKYRQEAADAQSRQAKVEEKLLMSVTEQDKVWRMCNLAEAQATELAQELAMQKSQADKMKAAFCEQTKLQEDMFLELQKITDELQSSRKKSADWQSEVEAVVSANMLMGARLKDLEAENQHMTVSLEETVIRCGQLNCSLKDLEASNLEMSSRVRDAELDVKAAQDKVITLNLQRVEAERSKDAAVSDALVLSEDILKVKAENEKVLKDKEASINDLLSRIQHCDLQVTEAQVTVKNFEVLKLEAEESRDAAMSHAKELETKLLEAEKSRDAATSRAKELDSKLLEAEESRDTAMSHAKELETKFLDVTAENEKALKEKESIIHELLSQLQQAELGIKSAEDKVTAINLLLVEVEESRDAALCRALELSEDILQVRAENEKALKDKESSIHKLLARTQQAELHATEAQEVVNETTILKIEAEQSRYAATSHALELEDKLLEVTVENEKALRDKEATMHDLLSQIQQAELSATAAQEKVTALNFLKVEAEASKDAAIHHAENINKQLSELRAHIEDALLEKEAMRSELFHQVQQAEVRAIAAEDKVIAVMNLKVEAEEYRDLVVRRAQEIEQDLYAVRAERDQALKDKQVMSTELLRSIQEIGIGAKVLEDKVKMITSQKEDAEKSRDTAVQFIQELEIEIAEARAEIEQALKDREASRIEIRSLVEQTSCCVKATLDKLTTITLLKSKAEESRDAAIHHAEELAVEVCKVKVDKEEALEAQRVLHGEVLDNLQCQMDDQVKTISSILQSKLAQLEGLQAVISGQKVVIHEQELHQAKLEADILQLRDHLENLQAEVASQKVVICDLDDKWKASLSDVTSLTEERVVLKFQAKEAARLAAEVKAVKDGLEEATRQLGEALANCRDVKVTYNDLVAEHESVKADFQKVEKCLSEACTKLEVLSNEYKAVKFQVEKQANDLESVIQERSSLTANLAGELQKSAALNSKNEELLNTLKCLQADLTLLEDLRLELIKKATMVTELEGQVFEQAHHIDIAENNCLQVKSTVKSLEEERDLLLTRVADIEEAYRVLQDAMLALEEEKYSLQASLDGLQEELAKSIAAEHKAQEAYENLLQTSVMQVDAPSFEETKSVLFEKTEELKRLEIHCAEQSYQIKVSENAYQVVERDCSRLVRTVRSLQDEREALRKRTAELEMALREMGGNMERLEHERAAVQRILDDLYEHDKQWITGHCTESVNTINFETNGKIHAYDRLGTAQHDVNKENFEAVNDGGVKTVDEKSKDRRTPEQIKGTDARLVDAMVDVTVLKIQPLGCKAKSALGLRPKVERYKEAVISEPMAKKLEVQVSLLSEEYFELKEALSLLDSMNSSLECELERLRECEVDLSQARYQIGELEKELDTTLVLLKGATTALVERKEEKVEMLRKIADISADGDHLRKELVDLNSGRRELENQLSLITSKTIDLERVTLELEKELDGARLQLEITVSDAGESNRLRETARKEVCQLSDRLVEAENKLCMERTMLTSVEEKNLDLSTQLKNLLVEKEDFEVVRQEQLRAEKNFQQSREEVSNLGDKLAKASEELLAEAGKVMLLESRCLGLKVQVEQLTSEKASLVDTVVAVKQELLLSDQESLQAQESFQQSLTFLEAENCRLSTERKMEELSCQKAVAALQAINSEVEGELQDLRSDVEELESDLQRYMSATEDRMLDLDNARRLVEFEALQLAAQMRAENAEFSTMLEALMSQVVNHRTSVTKWVESFNNFEIDLLRLKDGLIKMKGFELRVQQLEADLVAEQTMGIEYKKELMHLRGCLSDQAKRYNPFSAGFSFSSSAPPRLEIVPCDTTHIVGHTDSASKDVSRLTLQQKRSMGLLSRDRQTSKLKTTHVYQSTSLPMKVQPGSTSCVPSSLGNIQHSTRLKSRHQNGSSSVPIPHMAEKSKKVTIPVNQAVGPVRHPLRDISINTDEMNRLSPPVAKTSAYNLRRRQKVEEQLKLSPPRASRKRRRMH